MDEFVRGPFRFFVFVSFLGLSGMNRSERRNSQKVGRSITNWSRALPCRVGTNHPPTTFPFQIMLLNSEYLRNC